MPLHVPRLALVTGAGRRLGRAIALKLAAEGCDIAVHYRVSETEAFQTVRDVQALGRQAWPVCFNQADASDISQGLAELASDTRRTIDVLVNSASIFEWDNITTVEDEGLAKHFEANLYGPVLLTRRIVEAAQPNTRGLIINLLDQKLYNPNPDHLSYTLSKYALAGFTQLMARALAPRFRVCGVAPGLTLPGPDIEGERFAALHDATPLERGPTPDDIAGACGYLLKAPAVTGQVIVVDGGAHMQPAPRDVSFW